MSSTITVNLHNPQVQGVSVHDTGTVVVGLGDPEKYHGTVNVFFKNVDELKEFILDLDNQVAEIEAAERYAAVIEDRPSAAELEAHFAS